MQQYRQNQLLLLEDIKNVGRKGDIVVVRFGYANNYLLPQQKAIVVDKRTMRMQERLQKEREQQATEDRKESENIKSQIENKLFTVQVKVDSDGHLYGSVSALDIANLLTNAGFAIDKRFVRLTNPIKSLGEHKVTLRLKENVETAILVKVEAEDGFLPQEMSQEIAET